MAAHSKLQCVSVTCFEYAHPWTKSCTDAATGIGFSALLESFRIYSTVYMLALLMRGRYPTKKHIRTTLFGIAQSTAFLTCNGFSFMLLVCFFRRLFGRFNFLSISYLPAFVASYFSILLERPSRRGLLSLYVTNVASETLFRMAVYRGLVKPVQYGEVIIFTLSIAALLFFFKSQPYNKDSIYALLRFVVGPFEEKEYSENREDLPSQNVQKSSEQRARRSRRQSGLLGTLFAYFYKKYSQVVGALKCQGRHLACPHPFSCAYYVLQGTIKLFSIGYGLQVCLKLLLGMKRLVRNPKLIPKTFLHRGAFRLGAFLGGFSGSFRLTCCLLRRLFGSDSKYYAIPAGLIAGTTFAFHPNATIALYMMWKTLQLIWNKGVEMEYVPQVPGSTILLYCASTALLFHAAVMEPQNLRPSYWTFLLRLSGGRIAQMSRKPLDVYGLGSSEQLSRLCQTVTKL